MKKRLLIKWPAYLNMIDSLYKKIKWKKEKFDRIIALNRGGNIIGTILSHKAGVALTVIEPEQQVKSHKRILIVDEISDTGLTLQRTTKRLKDDGIDFKVATLHVKPKTVYTPDYYVETVNDWIVYPYERED